MIARRSKALFTPANVSDVHRRFQSILRRAAQKAEAEAKLPSKPLKPSIFSMARQRKSA